MNKIIRHISKPLNSLFVLIFLFSCTGNNKNEEGRSGQIIKIDLFSECNGVIENLSGFADEIQYIPLQTTENSLIGNVVRKIVFRDNKVYLQSRDEILCFSNSGKFLFKIKKSGRGPDEYTDIMDFDVSSDNKILIILSVVNHKLLIYELSEKEYIFQKYVLLKDPIPYKASIVPETDNIFLAIPPWSGTEHTLSLLINTAGDTINFKPNCYKYGFVKENNAKALNEMLVYSTGSMVCFKEEFSDTVFYVDRQDNYFKPRVIFDSNGVLITPGMRGGSETPRQNTIYFPYLLETSRYIFYLYGTREIRNKILFDKKINTKYKLVDENGLKEDYSGGPDFKIEFINNYCSGGKLFSFVDAITIKKYVSGEDFKNAKVKYPEKKNELINIANLLTETDNPVLIIVTPKD